MSNKWCDDFFDLVRQYFGYLFDDFGFRVISTVKGQSDSCLIFLESPQCRIKIYFAQGEANCLFGTLDAPISWQDVNDKGRQWHYIRGVLDYVDDKFRDLDDILLEMDHMWGIGEQLDSLSKRLKPVCQEVLALFESENFERSRSAYESHVQQSLSNIKKQQLQRERKT